jgi:hypothetical protein
MPSPAVSNPHARDHLKRAFEQSKANLAPYAGPTKSRADVEAPHPQRFRNDRVDRDAAHNSQNTVRVRR